MVIVPLNVPAARPVMSTEAVSVAGAVPLAGLTVSHGALSLTVESRVPAPVLVTLIVWLAGLLPTGGRREAQAGRVDPDGRLRRRPPCRYR